MKSKHRLLFRYGLLSLLLSAFMLTTASAQTAFFPLEITNIKPAGTGTPAIPATNRIFRAYPGIEYNIRAAVIGGVYPYTYSLSNAPSGMTINSRTGEISWPNPQSNSGTISLSVTDSINKKVTTSWAINVTTNGFRFVDASYSGTETGSISQPYRSLANFLTATFKGTESDIVYFKSGTYQMVNHNSSANHVMNLDANPRTWLAHPNSTVVLQGGSNTAQQAHRIFAMKSMYFDGLEFRDMVNYGIFTGNGALYKTVRRGKFAGLIPADNTNNNYGFIFISSSSSAKGFGTVIQDNEFTDWTGAAAIGSIYNEDKLLIESNRIHSPRATSTYSGIGTTVGIAPKADNDYFTLRGNMVIMNKGHLAAGLNAAYYQSDYSEICFNLFVNTGSAINHFDMAVGYQGTTKMWRNTHIAPLGIRAVSGPYTISNNIISNSGTPLQQNMTVTNYISHLPSPGFSSYSTVAESFTGSNATLLIDATNGYKLVPAHSAYIGSRGWQLADGLTPLELASSEGSLPIKGDAPAPSGLSIATKTN